MKELLENYTSYNLWANTKLSEFLKTAPAEALDLEQKSSFPSVRLTVYHMWDAEAIWYNRLLGTSFKEWPSAKYTGKGLDFIPDFLKQSMLFDEYVKLLSDEEIVSRYSYSNMEEKEFSNRRSDTILHCINHSTFHRGQAVTMLRGAGFTELDSTDYVMFCREMNL